MSNFTKHPPLQPLPDGKHWRVTETFEFYFDLLGVREVVKVFKNFISDLASIPKIFWSIIGGPWGKYGYASILHDFCYKYKLYSRKICDRIFLEAMEVLGVGWWKRGTMYNFVRWFAWIGWAKHRAREKKEKEETQDKD